MSASRDLTGRRFGRLLVLRRGENHVTQDDRVRSRWYCKCDCGKTVLTLGQNLTRKLSPTVSCGCKSREAIMTNMHRMQAARRASIARQREARIAGLAKPRAPATEVREDYRVRMTRVEKERQSAARDLARALGYVTGRS